MIINFGNQYLKTSRISRLYICDVSTYKVFGGTKKVRWGVSVVYRERYLHGASIGAVGYKDFITITEIFDSEDSAITRLNEILEIMQYRESA